MRKFQPCPVAVAVLPCVKALKGGIIKTLNGINYPELDKPGQPDGQLLMILLLITWTTTIKTNSEVHSIDNTTSVWPHTRAVDCHSSRLIQDVEKYVHMSRLRPLFSRALSTSPPCRTHRHALLETCETHCRPCEDRYSQKPCRHGSIDGTDFDTTFPHPLFLAYQMLTPPKTDS